MRCWVLAGLLTAAVSVGSTRAPAADLNDGPPPDRYGSAYDDPRYADMYKYPSRPPQYAPYAPPPGPAYRDDDDDDAYAPPRRFSYADPRPPYGPYGARCVPREEVRYRLTRQGWQDFQDAELRGEVATVRARRPSGRLFELTIHRCSGEIVDARPLEGRPFGPYAYGPRRWERPY